MRFADAAFWAFCAFVVAFVAWQYLRLLYEAYRDRQIRRSIKARPAGTGGVSGGDTSHGFVDAGTASDANASSSSGESGGDGGSGETSGGGEYGGGGASGGW